MTQEFPPTPCKFRPFFCFLPAVGTNWYFVRNSCQNALFPTTFVRGLGDRIPFLGGCLQNRRGLVLGSYYEVQKQGTPKKESFFTWDISHFPSAKKLWMNHVFWGCHLIRAGDVFCTNYPYPNKFRRTTFWLH